MKTMLMVAVVLMGFGLAGCAENPQCIQHDPLQARHGQNKAS